MASACVAATHAVVCVALEGMQLGTTPHDRISLSMGYFAFHIGYCAVADDFVFVCHHARPLLLCASALSRGPFSQNIRSQIQINHWKKKT